MENIDIKELISYFKSKLAIIFIAMMVVILAGSTYTFFLETPKYQSTTSIVLKNDSSNNSTYNYNDVSVNKSLVGTYSEIVKSKKVLKTVIRKLGLKYTYQDLTKMIKVSSVEETELIKIEVVDTDPTRAKEIANEVANVFVEEIPKLYNISNVSILDTAEEASFPYNINLKKKAVIYGAGGLALGLIIVFLIYYFDRTVKSKEQIESKLGLPVLGEVEEYKKGAK